MLVIFKANILWEGTDNQSVPMDFVITDDLEERRVTETLQPRKNSLLWQFSDLKILHIWFENAGDEAETGTKMQNMSIKKATRQTGLTMKMNVCYE